MADLKLILKQIEYYLSDKNLQHDQFFYDKLLNDPNGYLDLNYFLNCNNIKKLDIKIEDIQAALADSEILLLNKDKTGVKRKDEKLPNFLGKKRRDEEKNKDKTNDNTDGKDNKDNTICLINNYETNDPIILILSSNLDKAMKWKELVKKLKDAIPNYDVVYTRFGYQKGHAAIFPKNAESQNDDQPKELKLNDDCNETDKIDTAKKLDIAFEMDGIQITAKEANEQEAKDFWKEHGGHYEYCLGLKLNEMSKKKGNNKKVEKNILKVPVILGGET
jgi:hypothetical protein